MLIGQRLRQLRKEKGMSLGDVQHACGLLRCYTSRVEQGFMVPSLQNLEKFAAALDVPLYRLFDERANPRRANPHARSLEDLADHAGPAGREARFLLQIGMLLGKMDDTERAFLLKLAHRLAARPRKK